MALNSLIFLRASIKRFESVAPGDWIWQDGTAHKWQDGTQAVWQTGEAFPTSTGITGEGGEQMQWEDGSWMEWEPDTIPSAFSFTAITDADVSTSYTSDPIAVAGIDGTYTSDAGDIPLGVPMTITNAEYSVNGGPWTSVGQEVNLGDEIRVRITSSASNSTEVTATLNINGVTADFSVTTAAAAVDITPDAFAFTDATAQPLSTVVESNAITVSGIDAPAPFEVVGGQYQKNGGSWVNGLAVSGTGPALYVSNGDSIKLRVTTPASYSASSSSTLTINGVSDTFTATTDTAPAPDTTPDAFSFTDLTTVPTSTLTESNIITVAGIDAPAALTLTGTGEYQVNGGAWGSGATNVNLGDQIRLRQTSSGSNSTGTSLTLTIGGVSDTWTITTVAVAPATTTTLLTQPVWLEVVEDYAYPDKIGLAYYIADYRTQFKADTGAGSVLTATNSSELAAHIATAKSNSAISAIELTAGNYTWTRNSLAGLNRAADNPLVFRTKAGEVTQAVMSRILEESGTVAGVAFVDLDVTAGLLIQGDFTGTSASQDILVERCTGWCVIQGSRTASGGAGPAVTNVILRLNSFVNHWAPGTNVLTHGVFSWNVDGLLMEGNVIDHNGWDPAYDRTRSLALGGPSIRKHNVYISRPSSNVVCRYNWNSRPSSHGFHTKGGAYTYRNIFSRCPIGAQTGYGADGLYAAYGLVTDSRCEDNVFVGSEDITPADTRGIAVWLACSSSFIVDGNLVLFDRTSATNSAVYVIDRTFPLQGQVTNNTAYSWTPSSIYRGTNSYAENISSSGNTWAATSLSGSATTLAYQLGADPTAATANAWIDSYVASRQRLGVDIEQLKTWMDDLNAGITP